MSALIPDWTDSCPCGKGLHYTNATTAEMVKEMVCAFGPLLLVKVPGLGTWLVPRHYIALHGLKAADLPNLGFEKVGTDGSD